MTVRALGKRGLAETWKRLTASVPRAPVESLLRGAGPAPRYRQLEAARSRHLREIGDLVDAGAEAAAAEVLQLVLAIESELGGRDRGAHSGLRSSQAEERE